MAKKKEPEALTDEQRLDMIQELGSLIGKQHE